LVVLAVFWAAVAVADSTSRIFSRIASNHFILEVEGSAAAFVYK
jgi:hypothetical protein